MFGGVCVGNRRHNMGKTCFAPGCNATTRLHSFPKDPIRRAEWVRKTPGPGITLESCENKKLCSLHFHPDDFVDAKADQREGRGETLAYELLKPDAIPSVWPNSPHYLTTPEVKRRKTSLSTSEKRIAAESERQKVVFGNLDEL